MLSESTHTRVPGCSDVLPEPAWKLKVLAWPAFRSYGPNPYTKLLYSHLQELGVVSDDFSFWRGMTHRYDVFHLHWPEYYIAQKNPLKALLGTIAVLVVVWWQRLMGAKVVWTVHNLRSHNQTWPIAEDCFWSIFAKSLDGVFFLTENGRQLAVNLRPRLSKLCSFVVPHGHYREEYPNTLSREQARAVLGLHANSRVITFFGTIAPYKNIPRLIEAFRAGFEDDNMTLIIAGQCAYASELARVQSAAANDNRIRIIARHIPPAEAQVFLNCADLVVLPYSEILNSGSAILALSFDRPVLVPDQGAMPELRSSVSERWVRCYSGDLTPEVLLDAEMRARSIQNGERPSLQRLDWAEAARKTQDAYAILTGRTAHPCIASEDVAAQTISP
jgi:beta-1,4-mannosyltransferase